MQCCRIAVEPINHYVDMSMKMKIRGRFELQCKLQVIVIAKYYIARDILLK